MWHLDHKFFDIIPCLSAKAFHQKIEQNPTTHPVKFKTNILGTYFPYALRTALKIAFLG